MSKEGETTKYRHSNHGLFADHYLNDILPEQEIWTQIEDEARAAFVRIEAIYKVNKGILNENTPEESLEDSFIRAILKEINPYYVPRPVKKTSQGRWVPDYAFFKDASDRERAHNLIKEGLEVFNEATGIIEAKRWDLPLDRKLTGDRSYPAFQMREYLIQTKVKWGILTNGRIWRVYELTQSADFEKWYEVNLVELLDPSPQTSMGFRKPLSRLDAFKYFYLFFRKEAFPDFLTSVLEKSVNYELVVSADLKENAYEALRILAEGFAKSNPGILERERDKELIRKKCFILIYRLLFILFAESKPYKADERLLPCGNKVYDNDYSLWALKKQIADRTGEDISKRAFDRFDVVSSDLWAKLKGLFNLINCGSDKYHIKEFHVPDYNGGLFDPDLHKELDVQWDLKNRYLAEAVDLLSRAPKEDGVVLHYVDYGFLDIDKLGGIYEGLLENHLEIAKTAMVTAKIEGKEVLVPESEAKAVKKNERRKKVGQGEYYLVTDKGERKTSGSYYTPSILVDYIVKETLDPLIKRCKDEIEPRTKELEALLKKRKAQKDMEAEVAKIERELAELFPAKILSLRVLDPAMGSGHFLVSATKHLAKRLTEVSIGQESHSDESEYRTAKRRIVENCIFGVDKNELAVELAKVSLWIETVAKDRALSFLDHHLRRGDSLLGTTINSLTRLPHEKKSASGTSKLFTAPLSSVMEAAISIYTLIESDPSNTAQQVKSKAEKLQAARDLLRPYREVMDIWMADWFTDVNLDDYESAHVNLQSSTQDEREAEFKKLRLKDWFKNVHAEYTKHRFFHWELEFPEIFFDYDGNKQTEPGFDAVIGNPPWERIRLEEVQFFAGRSPEIAAATRASDRKRMIEKLESGNPALHEAFLEAKKSADSTLEFLHKSGFYPLMGRGDTNFYAVFAERAENIVKPLGRVGFLTPSGIATDNTTQFFFKELVDNRRLAVLFDFENKKKFFKDSHSSFKFSLILFGGSRVKLDEINAAFFLHKDEFEKLVAGSKDRVIELKPGDFALFNPNTRTCPIFRRRRDYELTKKIYEAAPILIDRSGKKEMNPWGIEFKAMFHMTNDSGLFRTTTELTKDEFYLVEGNVYKRGKVEYLPLYEGKMIWHYDHRFAELEQGDSRIIGRQVSEHAESINKADPKYSPTPRFWVDDEEVKKSVKGERNWFLGFRDISNATNERTFVSTIFPWSAVGNKLPLLLTERSAKEVSNLLANLCSTPFDYATRNKMMGTTLNYFIVEQLPVLPPERYDEEFKGRKLSAIISPKVLELCYTSHDLTGFARDMGYVNKNGTVKPPFRWDEERRLHLRCQLDALYFILYGLDTGEAREILDTFPIVKREDEKRHGRYRTCELIISYMNAYNAGDLDAEIKG